MRVLGQRADALGYHVHVADLSQRRRRRRTRLAATGLRVVHEPQPGASKQPTGGSGHSNSTTTKPDRIATGRVFHLETLM